MIRITAGVRRVAQDRAVWRLVWLIFAAGCDLYFPKTPPHVIDAAHVSPDASPDASADECSVGCGPGRHCEVQCSPYAPTNCIYNCHMTCMPDMTCATVTTCAPGSSCYDECLNECQGMADLCQLSCAVPDSSCQFITSEAACVARSDCRPIYHATGCTCVSLEMCTCTDEKSSFVRCASLTAP